MQHLGAIYEKLLEYQLEIAEVTLTEKGGKYTAAGAGDAIIKQPGQVYLRGGNNERKITGSYYTPDYIVRFIVERTLEPLLNDITQQYAQLESAGHLTQLAPPASLGAEGGVPTLSFPLPRQAVSLILIEWPVSP